MLIRGKFIIVTAPFITFNEKSFFGQCYMEIFDRESNVRKAIKIQSLKTRNCLLGSLSCVVWRAQNSTIIYIQLVHLVVAPLPN